MDYLQELEIMMKQKTPFNSFFNSTNETGQLLMNYESIAKGQETDILSVFNVGDMLTPYEVEYRLRNNPNRPLITSIRRSITNLTEKGLLVKNECGEMKLGAYGRKNYTWSLK